MKTVNEELRKKPWFDVLSHVSANFHRDTRKIIYEATIDREVATCKARLQVVMEDFVEAVVLRREFYKPYDYLYSDYYVEHVKR